MAKIIKASERKYNLSITGGAAAVRLSFDEWNGKFPNTFSILNYGTSVLNIGSNPALTTSENYFAQVAGGGGTGVFSIPAGLFEMYFVCAANADLIITAWYGEDIQPSDLYQTLSTVIINSTTTSSVTLASPIPAGTNNIGDVDIASALPAGTNNIGDVDIASALPAGTNNIGDVDIASALPAGDNNIGNVDVLTMPNIPTAIGTIYNVTMTSADTEYSQALTNVHKLAVSVQDGDSGINFRLAFVTGKVATPTAPYLKYVGNGQYYIDGLNMASMTVYIACSAAGKVAQLEVW